MLNVDDLIERVCWDERFSGKLKDLAHSFSQSGIVFGGQVFEVEEFRNLTDRNLKYAVSAKIPSNSGDLYLPRVIQLAMEACQLAKLYCFDNISESTPYPFICERKWSEIEQFLRMTDPLCLMLAYGESFTASDLPVWGGVDVNDGDAFIFWQK
jgi:hypothetical protein